MVFARLIIAITLASHAFCIGGEIPQPNSVRSVRGLLTDTLTLKESLVSAAGRTFTAATYNGRVPGSIWRVYPGDTLRIRLNNQLPPNSDQDSTDQGNYPQRVNTTNLHTHGLNVSPKGSSDNVLRSILPGESFDYEIIVPKNHSSGTHWYHPHHHTASFYQGSSSVAGTLIVEDPSDPALTDPILRGYQDRVLMFSMFMVDTTTNAVPKPRRLRAATANRPVMGIETPVLVNGAVRGTMSMRPGEIQRWRLINATYEPLVKLRWLRISGSDTAVVPQSEIAIDGLYYDAAKTVDSVVIPTGGRSDILVNAPSSAGQYVVELTTIDRTYTTTATRLAIDLVVEGTSVEPPMQMPKRLPPPCLSGPILDSEITGTREITVSEDRSVSPLVDSTAIMRTFLINNTPYNHDVVNVTVRVGDVEEWTVHNSGAEYHPFHIHVNEFLVTKINNEKLSPPVWRDVLWLSPKTTYTIRHRFQEFDGLTVLHCHFLMHEDWGMMNLIEILPKTSRVHEQPWTEPLAFPNPAVGRYAQISIRVPEFLMGKELVAILHDVTGSEITRQNVPANAGKTVFNVAEAPAGTYYVRLTDGVRFTNTDMIVLLR